MAQRISNDFNYQNRPRGSNKILDGVIDPSVSPILLNFTKNTFEKTKMAKKFNYVQIQGVQNNQFVTSKFIAEVENIATRLQTKPEYLLAAMSFETGGTFNPAKQNKILATGLIQFIRPTAKALGTTVDELKAMTSVEQLNFVEKYMTPFKGKLDTLEAVYTSILSGSPKKPADILFKEGTLAYKLNPLDWNLDGKITAAEATTIVAARLFGGVKVVQQFLLDSGFVPINLRADFVDGIWGNNTTNSLRDFQKSKNLSATGLMNEETGFAMFPDKDSVETTKPAFPEPSEKPMYPGRIIKLGENNPPIVSPIQLRLKALGCGDNLQGSGFFGNKTDAAVRLFQSRFTDTDGNPLDIDGEIGVATWAALFGTDTVPKPPESTSKLMQKALEFAVSQIGVMERPPGSNKGKEVEEYLASVGLGGGFAWCMAFVYWCYNQAAKELNIANPVFKTGGVLKHWEEARNNNIPRITTEQARNKPSRILPGMVFVIDTGDPGGAGHTGFVEKVIGDTLITIEGNTNLGGSREGIGVFRRTARKINSINKGFVDYSIF